MRDREEVAILRHMGRSGRVNPYDGHSGGYPGADRPAGRVTPIGSSSGKVTKKESEATSEAAPFLYDAAAGDDWLPGTELVGGRKSGRLP